MLYNLVKNRQHYNWTSCLGSRSSKFLELLPRLLEQLKAPRNVCRCHFACLFSTPESAMAEAELEFSEFTWKEMTSWIEVLCAISEVHYVGGTHITSEDDFVRDQRDRQEEWKALPVLKFYKSENVRKDKDYLLAYGGEQAEESRPWNSNDKSDDLVEAEGIVYVRSHNG